MILSNRKWNVNLSKESLLNEIDEEIQKEYQILNKFSSEKFSIILVIFGFLTIFISIWPLISHYIDKNQLIIFYLISANILILFWSYWEFIKRIVLAIFKISNFHNSIGSKISWNVLQMYDANERDKFKFLLTSDWIFAKKGEPHAWAFLIFLSTLIGISYANLRGWIEVPHMNDPIIFGATITIGLIIFSIIAIFANYYLNIKGFFWERLFEAFKIIQNESNSNRKMLFFGILSIITGITIFIVWIFFFNIFPILLLGFFVIPNLPILLKDLLNNFLLLSLIIILLNFLVEFIAIIYGIYLVETVKNEKIWWLETIRLDINAFSSEPSTGQDQLKCFYKKFDCSDIYTPVPIQRFFMFQKYVFLPTWIMKPSVDIDTCDDSDFNILKDRFNFHKNLIYRQKPF